MTGCENDSERILMSVFTEICPPFYFFDADMGLNAVFQYDTIALLALYRIYPFALISHFSHISYLTHGRACGSVGCDTGQCTNGCGFDSRSTCARLLGASMLCVGFPQLPLRLSSVFTTLRNVSFSSALYLCCFHSPKGGAG